MKKITFLSCLLTLLLISINASGQVYQPLQVTSGFNEDVIAETTPAGTTTTTAVDAATTGANNAFMSIGYPGATVGLPANGLINSAATTGLSFQLAAYTANNSLRINANGGQGTLVFQNLTKAKKVFVLATSGSASSTFTGVITFNDDTTQNISSQTIADWYQTGTVAMQGIGRVSRGDGNPDNNTSNPKLFQVAIDIAAANQTKQIKSIQFTKTSSVSGFLNIFGVSVEVAEDCPSPETTTFSAITANSATATWTVPVLVPAQGYLYELRTSGAAGSGTAGLVLSGPITALTTPLNGLAASTTYFFYIKSICSSTESSAWKAAGNFTTLCGIISNFPYITGFEQTQTCWTSSSISGTTNWIRIVGGSGDISGPHSGTSFMEKDYPTSQSMLVSPQFNLSALGSDARISVWLHRHASAHTNDEYKVYVNNANNLTGATELLSLKSLTTTAPTVPSTGWYRYTIPVPSSFNTSTSFYVIIRGTTTAGFSSYDLGVDDFTLEAMPTCFPPGNPTLSNLTATGVTATWNAATPLPGSGYSWEIRTIGNAGDPSPVAFGNVGAGILTANIPGLTPNTTYRLFVRSNCSVTDSSEWTTAVIFTTPCAAEMAPTVVQTFSNFGDTAPNPACWSEATGAVAAVSTLTGTTSKWFGSNFANTGSNTGAKINLYGLSNPGDWLISHPINLGSTAGVYRIKYDMALTNYNGTASQTTLGTHVVRVIVSTDGGVTWSNTNVVKTYTGAGTYSNTGQSETINLNTYSGIVKIAFVSTTSSYSPDVHFHIDNFVVEPIPACLSTVGSPVTNITKNTATINWQASLQQTLVGYEYEIRTSGAAGSGTTGLFQQGITLNVLTKDLVSLTPSTQYTVYVRTRCTDTSFSAWSPGIVFKTLCDYPDNLSITNNTVCGVGTTTISANFTNNNNIKWYASEAGGNALATGTSFIIPEVSSTTTFWVSAAADGIISGVGGKIQPASNATTSTSSNYGVVFNLAQDIVLKSTDVYSTASGTVNVKIINPSGVEIFSTGNVNVSNGGTTTPNVIPLNVALTAGNGYKILVKSYSGASLVRDSSGLSFPYTESNGILSVTSSEWGGTTTSYYYYFYNLQYDVICSSPRKPVTVTVTEAPEFTLSVNEVDICQGNDSQLLTIAAGSDDYDTFVWIPSEGVSGDAVNGWVINSQDSGIYILRASQSEGQCAIDFPVQVNVSEIGYLPLEEDYVICKDDILTLTVKDPSVQVSNLPQAPLVSYGFNEVPITGFTHTSVATTIAVNNTVFTEGNASIRFSHSANAEGKLTLTDPIDGSDAAALILTFDHIALLEGSSWDYGYVEYSLNGGSTWTVFKPTQYVGTATGLQAADYKRFAYSSYTDWPSSETATPTNSMWKAEKFILEASVGDLSQVKFRFSLKGDGIYHHYGWMIDNVKINKVSLPTTVWTGEGLYIDSSATQPYTGEDVQTVYFKQTQSGEYNVSATVTNPINNCSATTSTTVKVPLVVLPEMNNQVYCEPKAVEDLIFDRIDGYVYSWYASTTSASMISTINTTGTYYLQATSNEGECKSSRVPVEIIIADNLNPVVNASYTFCDQATFENIQVGTQYGAAVQWFATADSTTVLPASTQLSTTTYYVNIKIGDCESTRKPVSVTILQTPAPIAQQAFTVCFNTPLSQLSLGATNVKWYFNQTSTTALGVSAVAQNNTYYVTTFNGICESARIPVVVNVVQQLQMPTAATQNFCGSGTVSQLTATGAVSGAEYVWYNSATSTTPLQPTAALQNGTYYVSQKLTNCESPRRPVTVKVTNLTAPTATSFEFCGSATVADLSMPVISGITYNWYLPNQTTPLASTANLITGNYLVSKAQNGCESTKTIVQVTIKPRPASPTGSLTQNFMDSGMISDLVMDQSNVIWYVTYEDALSGNNPLQTNMPIEDGHIYYGVVIGSNGCPSLPTAVTATITLGVKDLDLASLKYYPNPVDSELTISYKEQIKLIEIYDLLGKQIKVQKFDSNDIRVNVSGLSSGTYMFRVQTNSGSQFIKIIKK